MDKEEFDSEVKKILDKKMIIPKPKKIHTIHTQKILNQKQLRRLVSSPPRSEKNEPLKDNGNKSFVEGGSKSKIDIFCTESIILPTQRAPLSNRFNVCITNTNSREFISFDTSSFDSFVQDIWKEYYGVIYILMDNNLDKLLPYKMVYIGQTIQKLRKRFYSHLNYPANRYLEQAVFRYQKKFKIIQVNENTLQTDGGEFIIKVVTKSKTLEDLNDEEKKYIKKYKSSILDHFYYDSKGQRKPLYGYNLTRGGGGYPIISGELHHSFKHVNQNILRDLISEGFTAVEIARELEISLPTLIDKIKFFWMKQGINSVRKARLAFGGRDAYLRRVNRMSRSVVGIDIDNAELIEKIEEGLFMGELENYFDVSFSTITKVLNGMNYDNLTDARIKLGAMDIFRERASLNKDKATLKGSDHQDYIYIDKERLKYLIQDNLSQESIANIFKVSRPTISARIKEYWSLTFKEVKKVFNLYPRVEKALQNISSTSIISGTSIIDLDKSYLIQLISKGYTEQRIAHLFGMSVQHIKKLILFYFKHLNFIPNQYFKTVRYEYYWKPLIISTFRHKLSLAKTTEYLQTSNKLIYLRKIWKKEFKEFNEDNDALFKYLKRFYYFYPKKNIILFHSVADLLPSQIDRAFKKKFHAIDIPIKDFHSYMERLDNYINFDRITLFSLLLMNLTPKQVDAEFLKHLVRVTNSMEQIVRALSMGTVQARNFLRNVLGMRYHKAIQEYKWKPELITFIKKYYSMKNISENEDINYSTLRARLMVVWKTDYDRLGQNLSELFRYLKIKYQ